MKSRSIRFRITAIATLGVAMVLIAGGAALVLLQRNALIASLNQTIAQRADDIVALAESGGVLPDELAASADEGFAQLVGSSGAVLVSTPNLSNRPALALEVDPGSSESLRTIAVPEVDDDMFRVLSRQVPGVGLLHVGTTYDVVAESTAALTRALVLIFPLVVAAVAAIVWWLVGKTLHPVEIMRMEVAEIGATDLGRRVPRPGTRDEIDRLAVTMNGMLARLETSIGRQQIFVADASHELRGPLTRMRAELEVDLADSADLAQRSILEGLLEEVVGLQHLVEDLLFLARADAGAAPNAFRSLDLDDLVLGEARRIQSRHRVEVDLSAVSGAHVMGDAGQLTRAIGNILDNAERHAKTRINLSLDESEGAAILVIGDDGPGISDDDSERVFERFTRLDEARSSEAGGSGLGLAISREIIERHDGSVNPSSLGRARGAL